MLELRDEREAGDRENDTIKVFSLIVEYKPRPAIYAYTPEPYFPPLYGDNRKENSVITIFERERDAV